MTFLASIRRFLSKEIQDLYPGCFAIVMAIGISQIDALRFNMISVAKILFGINKLLYVVLCGLSLVRLLFYFPYLRKDLGSISRGPGFLTIVAGTSVLGAQYILTERGYQLAIVLWVVACVIWPIVIYSALSAAILDRRNEGHEEQANGGCLLAVVSTQSISILGVMIGPYFGGLTSIANVVCGAMFLVGCVLYVVIIVPISRRLIYKKITPETITPSYWICMGAAAITTVSGSSLLTQIGAGVFRNIAALLEGITLLFWVIATLWMPLLLILFAWRHIIKRYRLSYEPSYWTIIFTVGMYASCTAEIAGVIAFPPLRMVSHVLTFITIALSVLMFCLSVVTILRNFTCAQ